MSVDGMRSDEMLNVRIFVSAIGPKIVPRDGRVTLLPAPQNEACVEQEKDEKPEDQKERVHDYLDSWCEPHRSCFAAHADCRRAAGPNGRLPRFKHGTGDRGARGRQLRPGQERRDQHRGNARTLRAVMAAIVPQQLAGR